MKIYLKKSYFFYFGGLLFFLLATRANAATLFLLPKTSELKIGQEFNVELKINSEGQGFNAAQGTLQFPKELLEVKSVDSSPNASVFNFWLANPSFSNADGKLTFIGGATNGISGSAIPILKVMFVAKGIGDGAITYSDSAVTASDGSGSNILSTMEIATFKVIPGVVKPTSVLSEPVAIPVLPKPVPIIRTPEKAQNLPVKPTPTIPLYPDQEKWYNLVSDFLVQWDLPKDVSGVSTAVNDNSTFVPAAQSEGLFDSKMFSSLGNGIHYLHLRFQNNVGWGPTEHYRLAIDTMPPLPFKIESTDGLKTGNPAPMISFSTSDSISGIKNYLVRVDNNDDIVLEKGSLTLPLLGPGQHHILVRAVDNAGNFLEDSVDLEILPLPTPTIGFVTKSVSFGELIYAVGKVQPGLGIQVKLNDEKGQEVFRGKGTVDPVGNWEMFIKDPLSTGQYSLVITAVDERGALSYPAETQSVRVRPQPVISIGSLELGWLEILLLFGLAIATLAGFAAWRYTAKREKRSAYETIIGRDIEKLTAMLEYDLQQLKKLSNSPSLDSSTHAEMEVRIAKMQEKIDKMKKYLPEEMEKMG